MGYTISVASVLKVQPWLDLLHKNKAQIFYIEANDVIGLTFLLNQGCAAAERLNVPPYEDLRKLYKFRAKADRILCLRKEHYIHTIKAYNEYPEPTDLLSLLDTYITNKGNGIEMKFPNIKQDEDVMEWLEDKPHSWEDGVLYVKPVL